MAVGSSPAISTFGRISGVSPWTFPGQGSPRNGKFRAECLNQHWFLTLDAARMKMEEWHRDYHEVRPHSAIGNKPPMSLMNSSGASGPP